MLKKKLKFKPFKRIETKWNLFDRHGVYTNREIADYKAREMNRQYHEFEKKNPRAWKLRATVNPLSNGMTEILVWYGI